MTFLPIVERELREGARRNANRYIRLVVAAVAMLISGVVLPFMMFLSRGASQGSAFFSIMTGYAFTLCLLAGVFVTADCISEEKREGTLGLLFLTDLQGYDVVLGKLASQFIHLGYGLLAIIPAAALPLLLGGVTGGELWRISLALLNLLFFSLATGLLASTLSHQAGRAMLLAGTILGFLCVVLPMAQRVVNQIGGTAVTAWLHGFSPADAYWGAMSARYARQPHAFWQALGVSHGIAWLMIGLASWRLPRAWQDRPQATHRSNLLERLGLRAAGTRVQRRRELLGREPLRWVIGESLFARGAAWVIAGLWALGMVAIGYLQSWETLMIVAIYGRMLFFPVKLLFAVQATRFFAESRRTGAFELLLAAPVSSADLVRAQWAMLKRVFLPPCLLAAGSSLLAALYILLRHADPLNGVLPGLGVMGVVGLFYMLEGVLDFFAMGWLGMWLALTMRKPHLAAGATILFVLVLPSVVCGVGFLVDIVLIAVFGSKLRADFRQLALARSAVPAP
ncbi:MAG TPA: hypothetical protein VFV96_01450 [Verrucomicrobiae bacterium]|nr:hypothetical protein [Verrucomicrobiae bacterium]